MDPGSARTAWLGLGSQQEIYPSTTTACSSSLKRLIRPLSPCISVMKSTHLFLSLSLLRPLAESFGIHSSEKKRKTRVLFLNKSFCEQRRLRFILYRISGQPLGLTIQTQGLSPRVPTSDPSRSVRKKIQRCQFSFSTTTTD